MQFVSKGSKWSAKVESRALSALKLASRAPRECVRKARILFFNFHPNEADKRNSLFFFRIPQILSRFHLDTKFFLQKVFFTGNTKIYYSLIGYQNSEDIFRFWFLIKTYLYVHYRAEFWDHLFFNNCFNYLNFDSVSDKVFSLVKLNAIKIPFKSVLKVKTFR